jgi:2-C-methyl-D-erythritol 4-phosphate cytidylyltransferase
MDKGKRPFGLKCAAIVVAGGAGLRMGSNVPKQFLKIADKPIMWWTLQKLADSGLFEEIVLVLPQGGARRQISVHNGLMQIDEDVDIVVVHDAVRPFVREETLKAVIEAANLNGAATAAMPAKDTIGISLDGELLSDVPDRSRLWHIQTPQAFRRELLQKAHKEGMDSGSFATDDCALVMRSGIKPAIVHGSEENVKITSPLDLIIAEYLARRKGRGDIDYE